MEARSNSSQNFAPHLALIAVQLMFGSAPVLGKAALQTFPSYAIVGFRVGGAALAFYLLQRMRGDLRLEKRSHYFYFVLFSLLGVVINQLLFFQGLSLTTATNTSLLAILIPVFALLVSVAIGYEKLSLLKIFGIILAASGVINLINPANANFSPETTLGDILIILNSLSYAIYVSVSKKLISHYGALKSIAWLFLFGSLINVPIGLVSLNSVEISEVSLNAWLAVLAIVLFPTIGAYYWNTWALARTEPSTVAVYVYLQPLIGFTSAAIFLNERITIWTLLSALLIFSGVFLVTRKKSAADASKVEI
jgi:drug/metabolite transporter (DMT)-like permease